MDVRVRPATIEEIREFLTGSEDGFVLESEDGRMMGHVGFWVPPTGGFFYGVDLVVSKMSPPTGAARLIQRLRAEAKVRGYNEVIFSVTEPHLSLLRLVESGKAKILGVQLSIGTQNAAEPRRPRIQHPDA